MEAKVGRVCPEFWVPGGDTVSGGRTQSLPRRPICLVWLCLVGMLARPGWPREAPYGCLQTQSGRWGWGW